MFKWLQFTFILRVPSKCLMKCLSQNFFDLQLFCWFWDSVSLSHDLACLVLVLFLLNLICFATFFVSRCFSFFISFVFLVCFLLLLLLACVCLITSLFLLFQLSLWFIVLEGHVCLLGLLYTCALILEENAYPLSVCFIVQVLLGLFVFC